MIESPLQKALRRIEERTLTFRDTGYTTNLIEIPFVEEVLQDMEREMTEICYDKIVKYSYR